MPEKENLKSNQGHIEEFKPELEAGQETGLWGQTVVHYIQTISVAQSYECSENITSWEFFDVVLSLLI